MRLTILPKTRWGKWSVGLLVAFVVFLGVGVLVVASGQQGGETFFDNLWISIPMLLAGTAGVLSFLAGLVSVIRNKERSVIVFLAVLIGLFVLIFCIGEVTVPH